MYPQHEKCLRDALGIIKNELIEEELPERLVRLVNRAEVIFRDIGMNREFSREALAVLIAIYEEFQDAPTKEKPKKSQGAFKSGDLVSVTFNRQERDGVFLEELKGQHTGKVKVRLEGDSKNSRVVEVERLSPRKEKPVKKEKSEPEAAEAS